MLKQLLHDFIVANNIKKILVGLSGGLDSVVLLHLLHNLPQDLLVSVRALHVQHNLQSEAATWQTFCAQLCADLQLEYNCVDLQVEAISKLGLEAAARQARYAAFAANLYPGEVLFTAQHANDQAETVITQLLRGGGVAGLAAMPQIKAFANSMHARPLLTILRQDLEVYAKENKLQWIEDPSNNDIKYARNAVRHNIMPQLENIRAGAVTTINRVAENCSDALVCLNALAEIDAANVVLSVGEISISSFVQLDTARQSNLLRYLCALWNVAPMQKKHFIQFATLITAEVDKMPHLRWGDAIARRYRDVIYIEHYAAPCAGFDVEWDLQSDLHLDNGLTLDANKYNQHAPSLQVATRNKLPERYSVRLRPDMKRDLKNCWQEWGVPPWQRDQIALLVKGREIIAVPGFLD